MIIITKIFFIVFLLINCTLINSFHFGIRRYFSADYDDIEDSVQEKEIINEFHGKNLIFKFIIF